MSEKARANIKVNSARLYWDWIDKHIQVLSNEAKLELYEDMKRIKNRIEEEWHDGKYD